MKWISLKKKKPPKGIDVIVCDEYGYVCVENTEDCYHNNAGCVGAGKTRSFQQTWLDGNGTRLVAWMPLPAFPKALCSKDADGEMPGGGPVHEDLSDALIFGDRNYK